MQLSLDVITLGVPDVEAARAFYSSAFSPTTTADGLDMHGTGELALRPLDALAADAGTDPAGRGFRGFVLSCIVAQPSEVEALVDAAVAGGATVLKPAKKGFFGGFSATYRAPDGVIWKLAAPSKKDTGPASDPPRPTETEVILGVAEPKASKAFYEALGMSADRDYGDKFVDFTISEGVCRLGLMPRRSLAKDAGVDADGHGFPAAVLTHGAGSRDAVESILEAAASAGGSVTVAATQGEEGGYAGYFTDPDGYPWKVTTRKEQGR
jgi:uncharacterized protein